MLDFMTSSPKDFLYFGQKMWQETWRFKSHEETGQYVAQQLYQAFTTPRGEPGLGLVQVYQLTPTAQLPVEMCPFTPPGAPVVVVLLGTYGICREWNSRQLFMGHQAIPLNQATVTRFLPTLPIILEQLQVDKTYFYDSGKLVGAQAYKGTFHVADMPTSWTDWQQTSLQNGYGLQSVLGFGGLASRSRGLYLLNAFAQKRVTAEQAQKFFWLQNFIGAALTATEHRTQVFMM